MTVPPRCGSKWADHSRVVALMKCLAGGSRAQFLDQKTADNMIWINCCPPLPSHRGATWRGGARSCELCAASVLHDLVPARYQLPKLTAETVRCIGNWRRESVRPVCCELLWRQLTVRSDRFC